MIKFDEGVPTLCGRVTWGNEVGFVVDITRTLYKVRWLDGNTTTHIRPTEPDDEQEAA